jgi:hypothetical protein
MRVSIEEQHNSLLTMLHLTVVRRNRRLIPCVQGREC